MGFYDRDYLQQGYRFGRRPFYQRGLGIPGIGPAVKWILVANLLVFLMQVLGADGYLTNWFGVWPASWRTDMQIWRLITYQFLHGDLLHILFNMIGLLSFGPLLERTWGTRTFLAFYLGCGASGGLSYILLAALKVLPVGFMIGASGAILGLVAACAIMFPQMTVLVYFLFPVPIRYVALIFIAIGLFVIFTGGHNAGGEAAHLGGMAAGAAFVLFRRNLEELSVRMKVMIWHRQIIKAAELQQEVDRILQKVHDHGLHSLTWREKATLRKATELEQRRLRGRS
jgi:membrane associated rhomboid family serine protease